MNVFEINVAHRAYVKWLGNREVPLFCVDNIYVDPNSVRRCAFQREFPTSGGYYPGRHQPLYSAEPGVAKFCVFIADLLSRATRKGISPESITTDFSIVTTPEKNLLEAQSQPHIDDAPMQGVIYLNDSDYGGTIFFRNRATRSMRVQTPVEKNHYEAISRQELQAARPIKYAVDSDENWEKVDTVEGLKNRLVIWPGNVFHSIEIKVPPEKGGLFEKRLTQRIIISRLS